MCRHTERDLRRSFAAQFDVDADVGVDAVDVDAEIEIEIDVDVDAGVGVDVDAGVDIDVDASVDADAQAEIFHIELRTVRIVDPCIHKLYQLFVFRYVQTLVTWQP